MASENTVNTETIDSNLEGEREEPPAAEQVQESSPEKAPTTDGGDVGDSASTGGFGTGAAAVVSAGLGLSSLTGTSLGDMLRSRAEIAGQIKAGTGGGGNPVEALYGTPWHTAALVNGLFALVAVLVGGVVLAAYARRADPRPWVRAMALGGAVLGVIGLLVSGGMYLDLFAGQPVMPTMGG